MNPEQKDVLFRVGAALIFMQSVEGLIRLCMTLVLQKDGPLTLEKLERQTAAELKRTLGYFLGELRKRAALEEGFDKLLQTFLEERNLLVHDVDSIPGWNLQTSEGCKTGREFVDAFILKTLEVQKVFAGLLRAWQEEANFDVPFPIEDEFFAEIDRDYKFRVNDIFFEKES
jgi:hypothetical protein